jgi:hypothetical protein
MGGRAENPGFRQLPSMPMLRAHCTTPSQNCMLPASNAPPRTRSGSCRTHVSLQLQPVLDGSRSLGPDPTRSRCRPALFPKDVTAARADASTLPTAARAASRRRAAAAESIRRGGGPGSLGDWQVQDQQENKFIVPAAMVSAVRHPHWWRREGEGRRAEVWNGLARQ